MRPLVLLYSEKRLDGEANIKINKDDGIYIRHYRQTLGDNEHLITSSSTMTAA